MRFGSVCSGIEAASVAWAPLGFTPAWFSEIAPFPSKVLAHRHPGVPNHGSLVGLADRLDGADRRIDLLVGGTPCQSFSVAGLRGGLADARGNLALEFARLAQALRPRWVLWENVPGVLSSDGGRAFGSILGALVQLGYGCAWRVLDARFFGVPQRRRRLFLVGHLGAAAPAGAVLFEPEGVRRNPPQGVEEGEDVAGTLGGGSGSRGWAPDTERMTFLGVVTAAGWQPSDGTWLAAHEAKQAHTLLAFDPTQVTHPENRSSARGDSAALASSARPPHIAYSITPEAGQGAALRACEVDVAPALTATAEAAGTDRGLRVVCVTGEQTHALRAEGADASEDGTGRGTPITTAGWQVRRLTPVECERLQGFPDGYTDVPGASDSTRYAALGNSMAIPVVRWLGERIARVDALLGAREAA